MDTNSSTVPPDSDSPSYSNKNRHVHTTHYPVSGKNGRLLFSILVLTIFLVLLYSCLPSIPTWAIAPQIMMTILLFVLSGFVVSFSLANEYKEFFEKFFLIVVLCGPLICYIAFSPIIIFYILSFFIITIYALYMATWRQDRDIRYDKIMESIYVVWIITGIFITIYNVGLFPQHEAISRALDLEMLKDFGISIDSKTFKNILDIRILMSIIFGLLLGVASLIEAFNRPLPEFENICNLPKIYLKSTTNKIIMLIAEPSLKVAELLLQSFQLLVNACWKMTATIGAYVYYFTFNFTHNLYLYIANKRIWKGILQVVFSLAIVVISSYLLLWLARLSITYLRIDINPLSFFYQHFSLLFSILFLSLGTLLFFSLCRPLWLGRRDWEISLHRVGLFGAMIVLAFAIASGAVHLLDYFKIVPLIGFNSIGPFLLSFLVLILVFMVYIIVKHVLNSDKFRKWNKQN